MKKEIFILSLLLLVLSVGYVSASDNLNASDTIAIADGSQDTAISSEFTGNFAELQNMINNADDGDVISLYKDYNSSGEIIDKELYIDGLGHYIDANEYMNNNTTEGINSYDIGYESCDPITSPVKLIFKDQTVKKGQEIEIATFEDDMGNTIRTDNLIEVEITDKNGKLADSFYLKFSDGYKYTCNLNDSTYTVSAKIPSSVATNAKVRKGTLTVFSNNIQPKASAASSNNIQLKASAAPSNNIQLKASDVTKYYKGSQKYSVTVTNNGKAVSGASVSIAINGKTSTVKTDKNGVATLALGQAPGTYQITSSYNGKKITTKVTIKQTITGKDASGTTQSTKYSVTVLNSDGTPLKKTKISFKIGSTSYSATTNDKGVATLDLKLKAGTYNIEATNPKTSEKIKNKLTVKTPQTIKIEAKDFTKYYGGSEKFTVKITDTSGKALANKQVKITINGQTYTKTTDKNGIASMKIGLNSKVYPTTVECDGKKVSVKVTVKATVAGRDVTKMYKNGTQYYATFVDSKGNLLKNTEVQFNINGVFYKRTTDSKGVAKMNINLIPKTYIITAQNPKTNEKFTNKITVKPTIVQNYDLTKYYKNASKYSLRLLGNNGKPVGAGVSVKLNINGVIYTKQSDANGYVRMNINLPPGTYTVTADYNGLKASNTIRVLNILSGKDINMEYKDGTQYEVKLLDGQGRPYANQNVRLNINGVFYNKVTDSNGIARLNINLKGGTYTITASYNGLSTSNTINIVVPMTSYVMGNYHFSVPKTCLVDGKLSYDNEAYIYDIYYDTGEYVQTVFYYQNDLGPAINHFITQYGATQIPYNGWIILDLHNAFSGTTRYSAMSCDGTFAYEINSDYINICKEIISSFR